MTLTEEETYLFHERVGMLIGDSKDPILLSQAEEIADKEILERRKMNEHPK